MAKSPYKMKGYSYPGTSPVAKVKDWNALYNQAKKDGADKKTLANMLSKAKSQKSADDYVEKNPDATRVKPYAEGSETV